MQALRGDGRGSLDGRGLVLGRRSAPGGGVRLRLIERFVAEQCLGEPVQAAAEADCLSCASSTTRLTSSQPLRRARRITRARISGRGSKEGLGGSDLAAP